MIDWDRVTKLRTDIGAAEFDDLVPLFLADMDDLACRLTSEDAAALEMLLHSLKNGALNLGFSGLADQCQNDERLAAAGGANTIDRAAIQQLYQAERAEFDAGLAKAAVA